MRYALVTGALALTTMLGTSAASAAEPNAAVCRNMDTKVGAALDTSQAADRQQAQRERNTGRDYCNHGYYKVGMDHLEQALKLLGSKT